MPPVEFKTFKLPPVNLDRLTKEINDSPLSPKLVSIAYAQPDLCAVFTSPLDPDVDEIILNGIIQSHGIVPVTRSVLSKYIIESETLDSVSKWVRVPAQSNDDTTNMVVPDAGQVVGVYYVNLTGSDPNTFAALAFDYGGPNEKIIAATRVSQDLTLNPQLPENQIVGDGVAKLGIVLINESLTESPVVGGHFETTEIS